MKVSINYQKELIYCLFYSIVCFIGINFLKYGIENTSIINSFSQMLIIIFYFIEKKNDSIIIMNKKEVTMKYSIEKEQFPKFTIAILIICYTLLNFISSYTVYKNVGNLGHYFNIFFVIVIDLLFFQNKIYSHHILSMILNINSCILYIYINRYKFTDILICIKIIINCYSFNFFLLLIKYINNKYFINIFLLGSFPGLFRFIYLIIQKKYIISFSFKQILFFVFRFLYYFFYYLILFKFDAQHIVFLDLILIGILDNKTNNKILFYISFIISIISGLIYVEILELNFCNLSKNIKKNIDQRALKETYLLAKNKNDSTSREESYSESESFFDESFYSKKIKKYELNNEN